jgi:aminopeptidase N
MKKSDLSAGRLRKNPSKISENCQFHTYRHANIIRMGKTVKRLFIDFQPQHYIVDIHPDRENKIFSGRVVIKGRKAGRPSQRLTFHQSGLKITKALVTYHDKKGDHEVEIDRINLHDNFNEVRLHASSTLYPGEYTVQMDFNGKITRAMNGVYPSFFDDKGTEKQIIATQFESHHAREVFPSIDEPEAKATFDLVLTTPAGETVLANTPVKKQSEKDGKLISEFETTPRMPTYLLAFAYGELEYQEAKTQNSVTIRTYATPNQVEFTGFALETAVKILEFYEDYFGIPYPLPKADLLALPDFASGAMENWGLITFREQALLVDPDNTSLSMKQYVAMVVGHELAHQWFGNLVTMRWWTDLWLNEGFASWIEFLAVDKLFPEWEMWTQFAVDDQQRAFRLDALEHTHPIEVEVRHPDEIRTIFDSISYSKGASIIHMLHEYLTPAIFQEGLRHYLKRHAYGNTDTVDLWQALEEVSGKPVSNFMHIWTSKPGFPLIKVDVGKDSLKLRQSRFYLNPETSHKAGIIWPVALLTANKDIPELMNAKELVVKTEGAGNLKLNRNQSGFYRSVYNAQHLEKLGKLIKRGQFNPLDRLGLLSDLFEAAKAGHARTVAALKFLEYFVDEDNNAVWDVIASGLVNIRAAMDDEDLRELMKPFIRKLVAKQLERLGWIPKKGESHFDRLLRPTILGLAAGADEAKVVRECIRQFNAMKKPEDIAPDLRGVVYTTAVRHGDKKTFDKLFKIHEESTLSEERVTITAALTSFKQSSLIERALGLIDTDSVRLQDVPYWVAYSFMNRFSRRATWEWMVDHWQWLYDNLGTDLSFYRFPLYAAGAFSDREFLKTFKDFFLPKREPSFERSIQQGIEVLTWQAAWKERDFTEIADYFKRQSNR